MRTHVVEPPHIALAPNTTPLGVPSLPRAALLSIQPSFYLRPKRTTRERESKDAHAAPERVHHVERLALAVLHRARSNVLDSRLVSADKHDVRHEHRRREHPKQTRSGVRAPLLDSAEDKFART